VIEYARPVVSSVKHAGEAIGSARDAAHEAREWASDVVQFAQGRAAKRGRGRPPIVLAVLALVGLGAIAILIVRARRRQVDTPAPDAFGQAVREQQSAARNGWERVATPGA
jgi:hypothetical protein